MRSHLLASLVLSLAPGLGAAAGSDANAAPCAAARVPIGAKAAAIVAEARAEIDAYRADWREACDPRRGAADVARLLSDAEALVTDVRLARVAGALARALEPDAAWPLPGVRRSGAGVDLDRATFAAFVERGTVDDVRFFRGFSRATGAGGEPAWLGPVPAEGAAPCLRLGEPRWAEVAQGLEEMERAKVEVYSRRAAALREQLLATLKTLGKGGAVCGCVKGDPVPALDALGSGASTALRTGSARVSWLREAPDAPATGCGVGPR